MKTAVSIPDPVFTSAERLKRRLGKSRSQIYAEAIAEFVRRHDLDEITKSWNTAAGQAEAGVDPLLSAAAARALENTEW